MWSRTWKFRTRFPLGGCTSWPGTPGQRGLPLTRTMISSVADFMQHRRTTNSGWLASTTISAIITTCTSQIRAKSLLKKNSKSFSWNLYQNEDPGDQLAWLVNKLTWFEAQGRKVHILAHIPPGGGSCVSSWAREFKKILDRQENIRVGLKKSY